jgi:ABC-2 type transport system permease protein
MKTMKWLIQRELWEHKGMLVWVPAAIAGLIAALALAATFLNQHMSLNGEEMTPQNIIVTIEGETRTRIVDTLAQGYAISAAPVYMVLGFLVFFYCLGALNDERRDRSILFWKSLPVSDLTTVASKVLVALVVAPLIVIGIALAMSLLLLLAVCVKVALHGTNLFGELLMTPDLYLTPLRVLALLPVYLLWALPTVGWLLMISSMVRSKVFLWAVGIPVVAGLVLLWAQKALGFGVDAPWIISNVLNRLLLGVVPGSWLGFTPRVAQLADDHVTNGLAAAIFNESWASLAQPQLWLGVVAGIAMLAVAVHMRRRREEG